MNRTDIIFRMFLRANDIAETVDFARKTRSYSGIVYHNVSKDALQGTPEFAAFVDGYEERHRRQDGLKLKDGLSLEDELLGIALLPELTKLAKDIYSVQYRLGRSFRNSV